MVVKMNPLEIREGIYWVGAIDWEERDFHDFNIDRGTTYNAYLIVDEKIALVDAVKHKFLGEMVERIRKIVDPSQIDYIIVNHVETDHSGGLADIRRVAKDATIICTKRGMDGISKHFDTEGWDFRVVKTGDELNIGKKTLMFLEMTMLHWPDSMATYVKEDKLLLSNDAFGQHIASEERFDEEIGIEEALNRAKIYYANILMPFGNLIQKKLKEVESLGIPIEMIAPSHGVIWKNPKRILQAYSRWAEFKPENKAVVIYDTMWKSTEKLARAIAEGIASAGVNVRLFHLRKDPWSTIMTEILDAGGIAIGSPTVHNTIFPPVAGFLIYMRGLKPRNKIGMAFGSYGWGGGAVKEINRTFEELKFDVVEPIEVRFRPTGEELERAFEAGKEMGERIKRA
jgi:flavorubredoxin